MCVHARPAHRRPIRVDFFTKMQSTDLLKLAGRGACTICITSNLCGIMTAPDVRRMSIAVAYDRDEN